MRCLHRRVLGEKAILRVYYMEQGFPKHPTESFYDWCDRIKFPNYKRIKGGVLSAKT